MNKQRRSVIVDGREVHSISQAAVDVLAERRRQMDVEGWTHEHDDGHSKGALGAAAACYVLHGTSRNPFKPDFFPFWPWAKRWWKPKSYRENLVRAGALILAEIERLDRSSHEQ